MCFKLLGNVKVLLHVKLNYILAGLTSCNVFLASFINNISVTHM